MRLVGWALVLLVVVGVLYLALRKTPSLKERLGSLDPGERAALESLIKEAGLSVEQIESISRFGIERAPRAVVLDGTHVIGLRLSDTQLARSDAAAGLVALEMLWLTGDKLTAVSGLDKLAALKDLVLDKNQLTSLAGLPTGLRRLSVVGNQLTSLRGLEALRSLERLDVSDNRLADLAPLAGHPALSELVAQKCGLTTAAGLRGLSKLELLRIEDNQLKSLAGLADMPALRRVWASRNQLEEVSALSGQKALERVDVSHNPLAAYPDVPLEVTFVIDGTPLENPANRVSDLPKTAYYNQRFEQTHEGNNAFYEWRGRYATVNGTFLVELMKNPAKRYVDFELTVGSGKARAYLTNPRGDGYLWVEATPGKPGRIKALLVNAQDRYYFVLESRDGEARDVAYVLSRKEGAAW